ncbi:MAG: type secretion system protein GspD, partial [Pseudomonadota bacterium]
MQIMQTMPIMRAMHFSQKQIAAAIAVCFFTVSNYPLAQPSNPFAAAIAAGAASAQKPATPASAPASAPPAAPFPAKPASAASAPSASASVPVPVPAVNPATPTNPAAPRVATPQVAPQPVANLSQIPSGGVSLMFDNADIYDVLKVILGDALKLDYVIDPSVQGRITLKSSGAVNLGDVYNVLEAALATSGVSIIKQDKLYRVTKEATALREKIPTTGQGPGSPVMQIIPVKFVQSSQLANTIRNFLGPQAIVTNDATGRYLIVADRSSSLEKVVEM